MSTKTFLAGLLAGVGFAGAFLAGARRVQAQAPADHAAQALTLIAEDRDTAVYYFKHEGRECYLASTRGGSGISLQCVK